MLKALQIGVILAAFTLSGCVVGTRNIDLEVPQYDGKEEAFGSVYIGIIEDDRQFEAEPRDPSIPSVDGNLSKTSEQTLATLIGRQRNGWGKAMGDVALPEGGSVQNEIRDLLAVGLEGRGYSVVDDKNAANTVTVDINKFWAWFSPGMWSVSFEAELECEINFSEQGETHTFEVTGYGLNRGQVASDANWKLAYRRASEDFLENLNKTLESLGL